MALTGKSAGDHEQDAGGVHGHLWERGAGEAERLEGDDLGSIEERLGTILVKHIAEVNNLSNQLKTNSDAVMIQVVGAQARCPQNVNDLNQTISEATTKFAEVEA